MVPHERKESQLTSLHHHWTMSCAESEDRPVGRAGQSVYLLPPIRDWSLITGGGGGATKR